jgi:hypothetical protein
MNINKRNLNIAMLLLLSCFSLLADPAGMFEDRKQNAKDQIYKINLKKKSISAHDKLVILIDEFLAKKNITQKLLKLKDDNNNEYSFLLSKIKGVFFIHLNSLEMVKIELDNPILNSKKVINLMISISLDMNGMSEDTERKEGP